MRRVVVAATVFVALLSCQSPTEPTDVCAEYASLCAGASIRPLSDAATHQFQYVANDWVDNEYGPSTHVYPVVVWRPCYFDAHGICAAGWTESVGRIHVSTAEPQRTGLLVCHETIHSRYWKQFGDPDAAHRRRYPC